jgi:TIGR03987 family protein
MLIYAIISINLALVFYSVGVWTEKIQGKLKAWHLMFFYIGLVCDTTGTLIMENISRVIGNINPDSYFHSITGILAIVLMLVHAFWATFVLIKKSDPLIKKFHKFSIFVWVIWLIPFISGFIVRMM